jgi:alpha,alpha-trehalose phosphorylase
MAAETGHLELAYDYFAEAAWMDLEDLEHNTRDGLHIASLAGSWIAAVAGFGGLRDHGGQLSFAPRLPPHLERLAFRINWRGRRLLVAVDAADARYELLAGDALEITHHGDQVEVHPGEPLTLGVPPPPEALPISQPPGREPKRRRPQRTA